MGEGPPGSGPDSDLVGKPDIQLPPAQTCQGDGPFPGLEPDIYAARFAVEETGGSRSLEPAGRSLPQERRVCGPETLPLCAARLARVSGDPPPGRAAVPSWTVPGRRRRHQEPRWTRAGTEEPVPRAGEQELPFAGNGSQDRVGFGVPSRVGGGAQWRAPLAWPLPQSPPGAADKSKQGSSAKKQAGGIISSEIPGQAEAGATEKGKTRLPEILAMIAEGKNPWGASSKDNLSTGRSSGPSFTPIRLFSQGKPAEGFCDARRLAALPSRRPAPRGSPDRGPMALLQAGDAARRQAQDDLFLAEACLFR